MADYCGWKNRQTWNVALWLNNDESLYTAACSFMKRNRFAQNAYRRFIKATGLAGERTPDGISYTGTRLDYPALNDMIQEFV